jgi:2-(1,2-epoxy-1,2-dihydrophenyl)acetyl-CoA isomerase
VSPDRLRLHVEGRLATLQLTGAERNNALDLAFVQQFDEATDALVRRCDAKDVDCVLITADGRHFSVGGDLSGFPADPNAATPYIRRMAEHAHRGMDRLHQLPVPVVARVQGAVAGAGLGFVLGADLAVGARSASFTPAYTVVGLSPDAGVSWHLSRTMGARRALDWLLANRRLPAEEALAWGLLTRVVDDDRLDEEVESLLAGVLALPGEVVRENKRLLREAGTRDLTTHLADEAATIAHLASQAYAIGRIATFLGR